MRENISIGIISKNSDYARALSISLMSVCREFIIRICEPVRFISEWKENSAGFDIVLWDGKEIEDSYRDNIIYLAENASLVRKDFDSNKFSIYKYCGAAAMTADIFEIYGALTGRGTAFIRKDRVRLLVFGSWEGGAGCTTVALATAQELQRFHRDKVLFVSLESIESTLRFFPHVPELRSIGEYLYRVLPDESLTENRPVPFIDSFVMKDLYGVEAFAPSRGGNPLRELDVDEMQKFIASIIDTGRYDVIVIDMGTSLSGAALASVDMADGICFVSGSSTVFCREEMYLGHMVACLGDGIMNRAVRVSNRTGRTGGAGEKSSFISTRTSVRPFVRSDSETEPEQLMLEGAFGEDIRKLTAILLKLR